MYQPGRIPASWKTPKTLYLCGVRAKILPTTLLNSIKILISDISQNVIRNKSNPQLEAKSVRMRAIVYQ